MLCAKLMAHISFCIALSILLYYLIRLPPVVTNDAKVSFSMPSHGSFGFVSTSASVGQNTAL